MWSLFSLSNLQLSLVLIRYLHGTSNPYPPPRLIIFPVTLVSKNDSVRVKNKEIYLDIAKGIWLTTLSSYITATVDRITCFTRHFEDGKINELLEVITEKLPNIMIRNRQQKKITDYFNFWCKINWHITKKITSFLQFHIPIVK